MKNAFTWYEVFAKSLGKDRQKYHLHLFYVFLLLVKNTRKSMLAQGSFQFRWKEIVGSFRSVLFLHLYEREQ